MSGRFSALGASRAAATKKAEVAELEAAPAAEASPAPAKRAKARDGKHGVMGYYSADLMRAMRMLSAEEGKTIQSLLGEAIDLLMRDRGKHPFGER